MMRPTASLSTDPHHLFSESAEAAKPSANWTVLPDELICNILKHLPFQDLATCQRLDQRTARVISDCLMLPCAYCHRLGSVYDESLFSTNQYKDEYRLWLLNSGRRDLVLWLDALQTHRHFSRALFFAVSKTFGQAASWHVRENDSFSVINSDELIDISPDGSTLLINRPPTVHIETLDGSGWKEECQVKLKVDNQWDRIEAEFSGRNMVIFSSCADFSILRREQNGWTEKFRIHFSELAQHRQITALFNSSCSHLLLTWLSGDIRILQCSDDQWQLTTTLRFKNSIYNTDLLLGGARLAISDFEKNLIILDVQGETLREEYSVQFPTAKATFKASSCGKRLVVGVHSRQASIVSFVENKWVTSHKLSSGVVTAQFSPSGKNLATINSDHTVCVMTLCGNSWIESIRSQFQQPTHSGYLNNLVFSPDGSKLLAAPQNNPRIWMQYVEGSWQIVSSKYNQYLLSNDLISTLFSPNGQASANYINFHLVQIMRYREGQWTQLCTKYGSRGVHSIRYTVDGRKLLICWNKEPAELRLYEIIPEQQRACHLADIPNHAT